VKIRFLTSTPLDFRRGSGTYVGISVLGRALEAIGHTVSYETPRVSLPVFTAQRLLFNRQLRADASYDLTVGFDMDGYRIAQGVPTHVASLKGVIADEVRFESGLTRLTMAMQARCEWLHVHRAARVLCTSRYSAERAREFYGLSQAPAIVPELIDLAEWRRMLAEHPASSGRFVALYVGRFYRRKRIDVLLRAAAIVRHRIPGFELRIVGNGPCAPAWRALARELKLDGAVTWLGDITRAELAAEYNRATVFSLPSVQEGFGIVLLEAMAAGKPIVAARAAAIPEVAPHAAFFQPDDPEALAAALEAPGQAAPPEWVEQFDAPIVARRFLAAALACVTASSTGR
jgi:glycosyltransferase involved in cell wall biosynthesis